MSSDRTYTTRRDFLAGSLGLLSVSSTLPLFLGRTSQALAAQYPTPHRNRDDSQRILVVVQLAGGNDGLNTLVPYQIDDYYRARPRLALPKQEVLPLEGPLGLHPNATGLKALYDAGHLAVVQGVGYPNPNRSHFTSTDIWMTADPRQRTKTGWIGRYFDAACAGEDRAPGALDGIALTSEAPQAMQGKTFTPLAFQNADTLRWNAPQGDHRAAEAFAALNNEKRLPATEDAPLVQFLQRAALDAQVGAAQIRAAVGRGRTRMRTGGSLSRQLDLVARMIRADFPTRVYYVSLGGFDTHAGQRGRHAALMRQLGNALQDFMATLTDDKLLDRVLIMTFSEFGRRVADNASGGTDHGKAAPLFIAGNAVKPGLHGRHPSLTQLDNGDLAYTVDFRRVYATAVEEWLGLDARHVLDHQNQPLRILDV